MFFRDPVVTEKSRMIFEDDCRVERNGKSSHIGETCPLRALRSMLGKGRRGTLKGGQHTVSSASANIRKVFSLAVRQRTPKSYAGPSCALLGSFLSRRSIFSRSPVQRMHKRACLYGV